MNKKIMGLSFVFGGLITWAVLFFGSAEIAQPRDNLEQGTTSETGVIADSTSRSANNSGVERFTNLKAGYRLVPGELQNDTFEGPIIQASVIAYSDFFSRAYGYPDKYVAPELPEYVDFIEYEMKYAGPFQKCQLKFLIDKDAPVELPQVATIAPLLGGNLEMFRATLPKRNQNYAEKEYQRDFRLNRSAFATLGVSPLNNSRLIGLGKPGTEQAMSSVSLPLSTANPGIFQEWNFVTLVLGCSELTKNIMEHQDVFVALQPKERTPRSKTKFVKGVGDVLPIQLPDQMKLEALQILKKIEF